MQYAYDWNNLTKKHSWIEIAKKSIFFNSLGADGCFPGFCGKIRLKLQGHLIQLQACVGFANEEHTRRPEKTTLGLCSSQCTAATHTCPTPKFL